MCKKIAFNQSILLIFAFAGFSAFAKGDSTAIKKDFANSFYASAIYFEFPKVRRFTVPFKYIGTYFPGNGGQGSDEFGLCYERKIYRNWHIGLGYVTWNTVPFLVNTYSPGGEQEPEWPTYKIIPQFKHGAIEYIQAYKMVDMYVAYRYNKFKKHKINVGVGASYAWGINTVVDSIYILAYDDILIAHQQKAQYFGTIAVMSYDYVCLHNRLDIGYDMKWRQYYGLYSPQFDYAIHLGFNF